MGTLTYKEQLLHPLWQRRRLEILNLHRFQCVGCEAADKTLHVHHKRYVKGRMVWDYPDDDLTALCLDCHREAHQAQEALEQELAQFFEGRLDLVLSLLMGWRNAILDCHVAPGDRDLINGVLPAGDDAERAYLIGNMVMYLWEQRKEDLDDFYAALITPGDWHEVLGRAAAQALGAKGEGPT